MRNSPRGLKLQLKYALVGRKGSPLPEVLKSDLSGSCDGATHFVRAALLGAFELGTSTEGAASGSAKVLGAGAETSSRSARSMNRKAGRLNACVSTSESTSPPQHCENLVQLQLAPVVAKASLESGDDSSEGTDRAEAAETPCSDGYVLTAKGCRRKSGATAYLCKSKNRAECEAQCDKGSAESCHNAARAQYRKGVHSDYKLARKAARAWFDKGCQGGYVPSCSSLAGLLRIGVNGDKKRARKLYQKACRSGYANACMALARAAESPSLAEDRTKFRPSPTSAYRYTEKACKLGSAFACSKLARRQIEGLGTLANVKQGLATLEKQCTSGNSFTCNEWADYLLTGKSGAQRDPAKALELYRQSCEKRNWGKACVSAGTLLARGNKGVKKDVAEARRYMEHACNNLRSYDGCVQLGRMHRDGKIGTRDPKTALSLFEKACPPNASFPRQGCYDAARLYESGAEGVKKQARRRQARRMREHARVSGPASATTERMRVAKPCVCSMRPSTLASWLGPTAPSAIRTVTSLPAPRLEALGPAASARRGLLVPRRADGHSANRCHAEVCPL